jgi:hypothetical protein
MKCKTKREVQNPEATFNAKANDDNYALAA